MRSTIARPDASEHAPYYGTYINAAASTLERTGQDDIRDLMLGQCDEIEALVRGISDEQANHGYAPGKWSLKESIVHICDAERVFAYRALRIARGDETPLSSFEQDDYVPTSRANARTMTDILSEFRAVRGASLALLNSFDNDAIARTGTASDRLFSTRALCWIMAGHAAHHVALTRDRYVPALKAM
ncbi:MAG: DinB family protein [Phycisphaerae bacterium]|nr:DinB family protein [Gemmatimonadaceae bacterium]